MKQQLNIEWTHLREVLTDFAEYLIQTAKDNLGRNKSYASGTLADSMSYSIEIEDDSAYVYIYMESYWDYVEFGRKAGKRPPVHRIYEWIQQKGINPTPVAPSVESLSYAIQHSIKEKKGYAPPRMAILDWIEKKNIQPQPKVPSLMELAWAISTSIGKNGTEPKPFYYRAKDDALRRYERPIADAIREDIETALHKQMEDFANLFK